MSSSCLKLNAVKTKFMWAASSKKHHLIDHSAIDIAGIKIAPLRCVTLLWVHIDEEFSVVANIGKIVSSRFFHLCQLKAIRRCLQTDSAKSLVNALIFSRLDYCNSIYAGLLQTQLDCLQSVFSAARLILVLTLALASLRCSGIIIVNTGFE